MFTDTKRNYVEGFDVRYWIRRDYIHADTPDPNAKLGSADARNLYAYFLISDSDGFNWRKRTIHEEKYYPDLLWENELEQAYITTLLNNARLRWAYGTTVPFAGQFRSVKEAGHIFLLRKIDVQLGTSGDIVIFETGATAARSWMPGLGSVYGAGFTNIQETNIPSFIDPNDGNKSFPAQTAIPFNNFLTEYVTGNCADIAARDFEVVSVDGITAVTYSYADLTNAYYVPGEEFMCRIGGDNKIISGSRLDFPVRIKISGSKISGPKVQKSAPSFAQPIPGLI
jgi:hypothetical protein